MAFGIKGGYVERSEPGYFVDASPLLHQPFVYEFAFTVALEREATGIFDVGCGRAGKLAALFPRRPDLRFVGVDHGANIEWCREHYRWGTWREVDLEQPHTLPAEGAVVVSSDVIEHLRDPRPHLAAIRDSGCIAAVFSTPERDLTWGHDHNGPPPNTCHVREWNRLEFGTFLETEGFRIVHNGLTETDNAGTGEKTTLILAEPA